MAGTVGENWECPYCGRAQVLSDERVGQMRTVRLHATIKSFRLGVYRRLRTLRSASVIEYGNTQCA
jgi:hypothetical protein